MNFKFSQIRNSVTLDVKDLALKFKSKDWKYMIWFIPVYGDVKVKMSNVNFLIEI